jgi:hypothetical protein
MPTHPGTFAGNYTFTVKATISSNGASEAQTTSPHNSALALPPFCSKMAA